MAVKDIKALRQDIYNNNPNDFLLTLKDDELLMELYYSNSPAYAKSSEKIRNKYKSYDDWYNSFDLKTKSATDIKKEKELKESPFNTSFVKSIADKYQEAGSPKIPTSGSNILKNLALIKYSINPSSFGKPNIIEGIAGDTQDAVGTLLDFATLGKAKGPVGQTIADLGTLTKQMVIGREKLETVREPTPGKAQEEFKTTRVIPQETFAGNITRNIGGYMVPFTGALKTLKAGTQATKFGKQLLESKPKITGGLQLYGATAITDQLVVDPEHAFMGQVLGNAVGEDKELLQDVLSYVTASPDKTEGENRVAVLFDSVFLAGAIGGVLWAGGKAFRSGKDMFNYFKDIKNNGTTEQKKQAALIIEDASNNSPKARKKPETIKDTIEEQEIKLNNQIAEGTSWQFSQNAFKRGAANIFNVMTKSRGLMTPKMFATLNLNKNAAIAYQNLGVQLKTQIDNTVKKLVKTGKYTEDDINEIIEVYLTQPNPDINKLVQKVLSPKEYDEFIKQQASKSRFTPEDLPIELKELVDESRKQIDNLSKILLGGKYISDDLKKEIANGYGSYLRKSYKKFSNPNYKPSQEVFDEAVVFISNQLKKNAQNKNKSQEDLEQMAIGQVNVILKTAKYSDDFFSFIDNVKGAKSGDVVFAERQKIAKEIENLLGVETQASSRIFNTMADVSQFISKQQTLSDFRELGLKGKYFYKEADGPFGQFDTQLKGERYGALNGMWTTKEMAANFIVPLSERQGFAYDALKFLYSAKGFAQAMKTVGNNITHERNLQSSGIIMLSNGLNPLSKETYKAVQTAWSAIKPTDNKAVNDLYNEYLRLGVTNQNAKLGDIRRLISESQNNVTGTFLDKAASKTGLSYLGRQVEKAYVAEDDLWKIAVYENELKFLKKAYPQEQLENLKLEAARITRNTMPTYDMIPSGFKLLRYSPFGNYFAFHAERFRNTFHNYKQAVNEIKSGNDVLKQRGWRRLSGQITVGQTGNLIVAGSSMYHTGVSKEEDGHIKNIFKQSYHGNNWLYDVQDKSGKLLFADTKYTDPSAPVNDVILTPIFEYLNTDKMTEAEFEDRLYKAVTTSMGNFVTPFIDTTILFDAVQDVFTRNGQVEGPDGQLFPLEGWDSTTDDFDTRLNNFMIGLNHIAKTAFLPVAVDNIANTIEINKEQPDKYGVVKDPDLNRFKNLAGMNYNVIDDANILKRISQKSKAFSSKTTDIQSRDLYKYDGESNVTIAQLKHQYLQANKKHYLNFTDLKRTINSAIELSKINPDRYGVTVDDIEKTLKDSGMSLKNINELVLSNDSDLFVPLTMSKEKIDNIIRMNPSINRTQLENELRDLKYELMNLPLLDIRDEYTESQTEALNLLYQRKPFFAGQRVSEDFPVTDVTPIPADRVDKNTGSPYSDQMARLGLSNGGVPLFEDRINNPSKYPYIRQGKELVTHRMAQSDNTAFPLVQLQPDGTLKDYGNDFESARKAAIKNNNIKVFKTEDEAIAYANNGYKTKEFNEYYDSERDRLNLNIGGVIREIAKQVAKKSTGSSGIKAYHGSPVDFDEFSTDFLKTGEGVNAYGKGLYFTETEGIAKSYKSNLSRQKEMREIYKENEKIKEEYNKIVYKDPSAPGFYSNLKSKLSKEEQKKADSLLFESRKKLQQIADLEDYVAEPSMFPGRMYQVNIQAKRKELFDWDKTIGKQDASIQDAILKVLKQLSDKELKAFIDDTARYPSWTKDGLGGRNQLITDALVAAQDITGEVFLKTVNKFSRSMGTGEKNIVEDILLKEGVPGIRYNDGFTRGKAGKKNKNYVIFDARIIDISKKYGITIPAAGKLLMEMDEGKDTPTTMRENFYSGGPTGQETRATRNNNPFNIVYGPAIGAGNIMWEGKLEYNPEIEDTFERFQDNVYGYRAGILNTLTHYDRDGLNTVEKLVTKHAPLEGDIITDKYENPNQKNFINFVSKRLGVKPNQEINLRNKDVMKEYAKSVSMFEGFANPQDDDISKAIDLAYKYRNIE